MTISSFGQSRLFFDFERRYGPNDNILAPLVASAAVRPFSLRGPGYLGINPYSGQNMISFGSSLFEPPPYVGPTMYLLATSFYYNIPDTPANRELPIHFYVHPGSGFSSYYPSTKIEVGELGVWHKFSGEVPWWYSFTVKAYQIPPGTNYERFVEFGFDDFEVFWIPVPEPTAALIIFLGISAFVALRPARRAPGCGDIPGGCSRAGDPNVTHG